jgi:hypothetical protein
MLQPADGRAEPVQKLLGGDKTSYQTFKDPAGCRDRIPDQGLALVPPAARARRVRRNDGPALFIDYHIKLVTG